jgi:hypothetical protein
LKKLMLSSAVAVALSVGVTAAQADNASHPNHGHHHSAQSPTQGHRCGVVKKGFTVYGDQASSTATQTNGKWNGPFTINDITRVNHHAKKAGLDPLPFTSGVTFTLSNTQVIFVGVTDINADTQVGLDDLQPTDTVKLIGKIKYAKKGGHGDNACPDQGFGSDRYDDPDSATIRQVVIHRPGAQETPDTPEAPQTQ